MIQLTSEAELREFRRDLTGSVGFVPTMGALHAGHQSLVDTSLRGTDHTIVSIYVNPTQFNNANDLTNYPDTLTEDLEQLQKQGVSAVFRPDYALLYPDDFAYLVDENQLSKLLCGEQRPGHFTGVLTVVMKLLNLVKPDKVFFGEKDYQQYLLVKGMAKAFFLDSEIIACPIVREEDGLAMSSRNLNLSDCDRKKAPAFHEILRTSTDDDQAKEKLAAAGFEVDYVESKSGRRFGAVVMGDEKTPVRLIDNVALG